jgi:ribosome-binding factor A
MSKRRRGGRSTPAGGAGAGPSQRQLRVGEAIRQALAELIQRGLRDEAGTELPATVTEVRPSPDLRNATCFVVPLGDAAADVVTPLNRLAPQLAGAVGRQLRLKYAPRLSFVYDRSFDTACSIDALLRRPEVARDLAGGRGDSED